MPLKVAPRQGKEPRARRRGSRARLPPPPPVQLSAGSHEMMREMRDEQDNNIRVLNVMGNLYAPSKPNSKGFETLQGEAKIKN